jgi:hypothetical protein
MPKRSSTKRPLDPNQLAKSILDEATGETDRFAPKEAEPAKNSGNVPPEKAGGKKRSNTKVAKIPAKK